MNVSHTKFKVVATLRESMVYVILQGSEALLEEIISSEDANPGTPTDTADSKVL